MRSDSISILAGLLLCSCLLLGDAVMADSITLLSSARRPQEASIITLGDIAKLEGTEAMGWAKLPIVETDDRDTVHITIAQVRNRLDEAGVHWGRVNLHGQVVVVRQDLARSAQPPAAMQSMNIHRDAAAISRKVHKSPVPVDENARTLRGAVLRFLLAKLDTTVDSIQVVFDANDDRWLDSPLDEIRYEIKALSDLNMSDRIDLEIRRWSKGRPGERRLLKVKPLIRCTVAEASMNIPRHSTIQPDQIKAVETWLTPSQRTIRLQPVDVVGRVPVAPLRKGTLFRARDIRAVQLVDRGDSVVVRCLVGGAAISLKARAESAGGLGERIELRKGRERETFMAVVTGPGEAVIDMENPVAGS